MDEFFDKIKAKHIVIFLCCLCALIFSCGAYFSVGAGEVSVTFNSVTGTTESFSQGMYFKLPLITSVHDFDVKTQKKDVEADSASKDLQKVFVHVVINYHLQYDKVNNLYVKVGRDYEDKVIIPAVNESVKAVTAQFPVEDIIVKRETLKERIEKMLTERLEVYDIVLESINLVNISFDKEFTATVEAKQIEEQKIKTAEYKRQQAEKDKATSILNAEAKAREQQLMSQSATKSGIQLEWIKRWDGKLPVFVSDGKTIMMVDPGKIKE